jgi:hypothetical protein
MDAAHSWVKGGGVFVNLQHRKKEEADLENSRQAFQKNRQTKYI